jgi:hypothetical protein
MPILPFSTNTKRKTEAGAGRMLAEIRRTDGETDAQ